MTEFPGRTIRGLFALPKNRSPILWIGLAVLLSAVALVLVFSLGGKSQKVGQIPAEILAKIDREKAKARQEHAEFMKTPAGHLWQRHPYWSLETCQKIIEGQVFPGMSKEQAKEAVGRVIQVKEKRGDQQPEEWAVEGRSGERMILKFEGNALVEIERK
ncbi:MAG: hypothetical protein AMJ94_14580 [Deltaproteobacteria bacterium SM23_61]|nr:MAG: hypothetical protein AMJ94_14580 [Deltaproteobacteria bacterium SM23_61]